MLEDPFGYEDASEQPRWIVKLAWLIAFVLLVIACIPWHHIP